MSGVVENQFVQAGGQRPAGITAGQVEPQSLQGEVGKGEPTLAAQPEA
jgi:hypothetical protein